MISQSSVRIILLTGIILMPTAFSKLPVPNFNAQYALYVKGLEVGQGNITLTEPSKNQYHMEMKAEPSSIAALFSSVQLSETVTGKFQNKLIQPISYTQSKADKKSSTYSSYTFNWAKNLVSFNIKNKVGSLRTGQLALTENLVDPLSLHLLLMSDLVGNIKRASYRFIDNGEIKTYQITHAGYEEVIINKQKIKAYKVIQQREGASRQTIILLDPTRHYLPVQITQFKNGKSQLSMQLTRAN